MLKIGFSCPSSSGRSVLRPLPWLIAAMRLGSLGTGAQHRSEQGQVLAGRLDDLAGGCLRKEFPRTGIPPLPRRQNQNLMRQNQMHMERRELACAVAFALVALVAGTLIARDLELPPEWNRVLDSSTGKYYYWNTASNEVQWHKPLATSIAELDDADDLLRGTGIEGFDYRILEAANGDVDDLFIGGAELQRELKFAGNNDTGTSAQPGDEDDKDNNVDEEKDRVDTQETPVAAARSKTERFFHGGSSWPLPGAAAAQVSAENNAAADDSCAQPHNKGTDSGASCRSGQQGVPPGPPVSPETHAHFARFDKNGDGGLDDAEFFAALRGTPLDPAELSHDDAEVVKGFLAEGSGRVSFTQWASLWEEEDAEDDENEEDDVDGEEGGGLGKAERQRVGGGGSRFAEGDLVRIMGFDSSHEMSLYNGEIGDVVSWTAELVVVKTSVQKKVFDLSLSSSSRPRFFLSRVWHCVLSFFCPLLSSLQQHTSCSVVPRTLWLLLVSLFRVRKSCCSSRFPGP